MKSCGAIPDGAEYWWKTYPVYKKEKRKISPHDCKPRGGIKGEPFRRFCKVCGKAFSKRFDKD